MHVAQSAGKLFSFILNKRKLWISTVGSAHDSTAFIDCVNNGSAKLSLSLSNESLKNAEIVGGSSRRGKVCVICVPRLKSSFVLD